MKATNVTELLQAIAAADGAVDPYGLADDDLIITEVDRWLAVLAQQGFIKPQGESYGCRITPLGMSVVTTIERNRALMRQGLTPEPRPLPETEREGKGSGTEGKPDRAGAGRRDSARPGAKLG